MKRLGRMALLGAAVMTTLAFTGVSVDARELEEITKSKKINLGYVNYPPLMIRDPRTGQLSGVFIEALTKVFTEIKIEPVWVEQTWATFAASLQSDQIDVFIGASFATPQRSLALAFTQPFAFMGNGVVVRKKDAEGRFKEVKKLEDLDQPGLTIASPLGGAPHDYLKANFKNAKIVGVESTHQSTGSLEVLAGRADASYWDSFISARDVANNSNELIDLFADNPLNVSPISWAIKQNQPNLLAFLNTVLEYMESNGTWRQFEAKHANDLGGYFHRKRDYVPSGGPQSQAKIQ